MKRAALALALLPSLAQAQDVRAIDGDTIILNHEHIRLEGIDAPELAQTCRDGWPAGKYARDYLQLHLTIANRIECKRSGQDAYGRTLASCTADGLDLNRALVASGLAWAYVRYSNLYFPEETRARALDLGIHAHPCRPAWEWRREHRK